MKKIRPKHGPEWRIQRDFIRFLRARSWWIERTHGNMFQCGFPDLYVTHKKFGQRWIDVKNPVSYRYTKAQCQKWPVWHEYGIGIWIIVAATVGEYDKLFKPPNWRDYWKPRYDEYLLNPATLLVELQHEETKIETPDQTKKSSGIILTETDLSWLNELGDK